MPTPEIYSQMTTEDLLALRQGNYDKISSPGLQLLRGTGGAEFGKAADTGEVGTAASPRPYTGAPDLPLEAPAPFMDPIDYVPGIGGMNAGVKAGAQVGSDLLARPLRSLARLRFGTNPAGGFENVAETVIKTAPEAVRPATATAEGLSDVMRGGGGKAALQTSRETGIGGLYTELLAAEKAAVSEVPGRADRFKSLVTELADANRAAYNPVTAEARTGTLSLVPQRERAAILNEIQQTLTPDQWKKFLDLQKEYAQGSELIRLFRPTKTGSRDVLIDQAKLQERAREAQARLDPELLKAVFRGGKPLVTDRSVKVPIGFSKYVGTVNTPGTILSGPAGPFQEWLMRILGATGGGAGSAGLGVGLSRGLSQ